MCSSTPCRWEMERIKIGHAQVDGAAGDKAVAPEDIHTDAGVAHVHQAVVGVAARLGTAGGQQSGVGGLLGGWRTPASCPHGRTYCGSPPRWT